MIAILATNNFIFLNFDLWTIYCGQYHPCNHEYSCNVHIATPFVLRGYYIVRIFKITITHDNCWSVFIFCDLWFHVVLGLNHLQSGFILHSFSRWVIGSQNSCNLVVWVFLLWILWNLSLLDKTFSFPNVFWSGPNVLVTKVYDVYNNWVTILLHYS